MRCPYCNEEITSKQRYCPSCGSVINEYSTVAWGNKTTSQKEEINTVVSDDDATISADNTLHTSKCDYISDEDKTITALNDDVSIYNNVQAESEPNHTVIQRKNSNNKRLVISLSVIAFLLVGTFVFFMLPIGKYYRTVMNVKAKKFDRAFELYDDLDKKYQKKFVVVPTKESWSDSWDKSGTIKYLYDSYGNITAMINDNVTIDYIYKDSLLVEMNEEVMLEPDNIRCFYNSDNKLIKAEYDEGTDAIIMTYKYNDDGDCISKSLEDKKVEYFYEDGLCVREVQGNYEYLYEYNKDDRCISWKKISDGDIIYQRDIRYSDYKIYLKTDDYMEQDKNLNIYLRH